MTALLMALLCSIQAGAAVAPIKPKPQKILQGSGAQAGGIAGSGFSLMNVKSTINPTARLERLMIDVGDLDGRPLKGLPGYFNVELQNNSQRIVIDFAQMPVSQMDLKALKERFKKSLYVENIKMLEDPSDNTLSLIMDLKKPVKVKVFQVPGQKTTSKVVLDLMS